MTFGINVKNASNEVIINDRQGWLRLFATGTTSITGSFTAVYGANSPSVTLTTYGHTASFSGFPEDTGFVFALKTDFGYTTPFEPKRSNGEIVGFDSWSTSSTNLEFAVFVPIEYDTFTTSETHGLQVFSDAGNVLYDSRLSELLFKDLLTVPGGIASESTLNHASNPESWFAVSMFPREVAFVSQTGGGGTSDIIYKSFKQQTNTSTLKTFSRIRIGGLISNDQTVAYSGSMLIPDPVSFT